MKFTICNVKGKVLDEIDLDILNDWALAEAYNMPDNVYKAVNFMAFDSESRKGRYYSTYFVFHLQDNLLMGFSFNSFDENKLTVSYSFVNAGDIKQITPLTIEEVKDVIRMSNKEES